MSEIYMRKKAFWNEKKYDEKNRKAISIILGLLFIFILVGIIIPNREHIFKQITDFNENESIKFTKIYPLSLYTEKKKNRLKCFILSNSKICENISKKKKEKTSDIYLTSRLKYIWNDSALILRFNPILQSTPQEEDYYKQKFNIAYRHLLFLQCISQTGTNYDLKKISRDLELFYTFLLNKPKLEFEITNDYESDINYYNNHMCFISGSAHLALKTKIIPRCIEFKNFHINNFYFLSKRESNIYFKFHVFKLNQNNKIHIYPSSKQMINYYLIKQYADIIDYFEFKNVLIYLDHNTGDKMIRICNVLSTVDPAYYDNNFWMEIVWNPEIQNLLCVEKINYIN